MKKNLRLALCAMLFALSYSASAQPLKKVPHIRFLAATSPSAVSARVRQFEQGLRELGYLEGKNIIIEYRYADGKLERLTTLATELARLKVDIIITAGPSATRSAKAATNTIPVVMAQDTDPVGNGFVAGLAQPGGNITGLSQIAPELAGKRLEILKEIVPKLGRVAVFGTSTQPGNTQSLKETELAADAFRVQVQYQERCGVPRILRLRSERQAKGVLKQASCSGAPCSILTEDRLPTSRQRVDSRRYTTFRNTLKTAGL